MDLDSVHDGSGRYMYDNWTLHKCSTIPILKQMFYHTNLKQMLYHTNFETSAYSGPQMTLNTTKTKCSINALLVSLSPKYHSTSFTTNYCQVAAHVASDKCTEWLQNDLVWVTTSNLK